jgi:hypothetical protein
LGFLPAVDGASNVLDHEGVLNGKGVVAFSIHHHLLLYYELLLVVVSMIEVHLLCHEGQLVSIHRHAPHHLDVRGNRVVIDSANVLLIKGSLAHLALTVLYVRVIALLHHHLLLILLR